MLQRLIRRRLVAKLRTLTQGAIRFSDSVSSEVFGNAVAETKDFSLAVQDPAFYGRIATGGSLGFAESYLRGEWKTDHLTGLLRTLYQHFDAADSIGIVPHIGRLLRSTVGPLHRNTRDKSKRQIAAHYDLSNDFFRLFLDPTMMYSSAWFADPETSLHAASVAKLERICQKLRLQPNDNILEIGTGWGGLALHVVENHDCDITTTTISKAQLTHARQRFAEAGIADRIRLLESDYRDLVGQFDKLVSIEMVEAVGEQFLDTYFRCCGNLLRPGGKFAMQAIVMPESRYKSYRHGTDFIQKYIFPGGFLPSVAAMQESVGRVSDLRLETVEDMSSHYARTLECWRNRFFKHLPEVRELGFDDRFIRMWEYYLCYCEAAFREQAVRVVQIVWDKPQ